MQNIKRKSSLTTVLFFFFNVNESVHNALNVNGDKEISTFL